MRKTCILAGDFNVDLIQYGSNSHVDNFYDEISSFNFRPLILQPTRVNSRSRTLIDNIFINDVACFSTGGNITCSISDHFRQFCQIDLFEKQQPDKKINYSRDWRNFNQERFSYELSNLNWDNVTSTDHQTDSSVANFYNKITDLLDEMAPVKRLTHKEKGLIERPWINSGILKSIQSRDKCYDEFRRETNKSIKITKYEIFKRKRNKITSLIRISKREYYSNYFLENQSNIKKPGVG